MDIDLNTLVQWFQKLGVPNPARDWMIAALSAAVVALLGIAFAAYLFWGVQTGTIIAASQTVPRAPIPVSRDAIKKVLEIYEARATNYVAQNFVSVNLIDPRATVRK